MQFFVDVDALKMSYKISLKLLWVSDLPLRFPLDARK